MANKPIGNNFWEGALGPVRLEFNDVALGKTTEDTEIEFIEDIADIIFQQTGTQPDDKIPTGQAYQVTCTLGEVTTSRLAESGIIRGTSLSGGGNSMLLGRDLYRSGRENFAKKLVLKRVDSDGNSWTNQFFWLTFYNAMPTLGGPLNFSSETQKNIQIIFYIFFDETNNAFGYSGHPTSLGVLEAA